MARTRICWWGRVAPWRPKPVLGTHGFWIARAWRGCINHLSDRYGLVHHYSDTQAEEAIAKIEELVNRPDLKADARIRADKLLKENVDLT